MELLDGYGRGLVASRREVRMNRWAVGLAVGLAVFLWSKRVQYRAEADSRVLFAETYGGGYSDVLRAEAIGEGRRTIKVLAVNCERYPSETDAIRLRARGFTRVVCESSRGTASGSLGDAPFLASVLDPD